MENSLNNLPVWGIESQTGYKPKTTYWQDFSIADKFGEKAVQDTYNRSMNDLKNGVGGVVYLTEFVMVLNWKIWQHHDSATILLRGCMTGYGVKQTSMLATLWKGGC